ncbi:MAG: sce7726 family protein [Clostridia bacterium]
MLDAEIREPLFFYLETQYGKVRIFEEKNIGKSRADVIAVTDGALIGLEIKSDGDSYARLKSQIRDYNKYCSRNYIVVGASHRLHAEEHVPPFWGVLVVSRDPDTKLPKIEEQKAAAPNPKPTLKWQLALLWRNELAHILKQNNLPKYPHQSKQFLCEKLLEKVPPQTLLRQMTDEIFERDYTVYDA